MAGEGYTRVENWRVDPAISNHSAVILFANRFTGMIFVVKQLCEPVSGPEGDGQGSNVETMG